ncbi:MAG: DUF3990 domain-containing protein [Clostridiales Family XIII bacterium]|nr:DUF3990 domain-containing protein [Clostridiales Family XIII bacterium]
MMQTPEIAREIPKCMGGSPKTTLAAAELEGNAVRISGETRLLYHGSKSGIVGDIQPISRERCDFGRGFYMGTERTQALTLICNFPNAKLYTLRADLAGLCILDVGLGIDWALLIAFHRGRLHSVVERKIYQKYADMSDGCDMIVGYIADDRMFVVLDRFFSGEITDTALIASLSALKLGKQYVAISEKACRQIEILEEISLDEEERAVLRVVGEKHRQEGIRQADEICRKHRRDGRFFDEIIDGWQG